MPCVMHPFPSSKSTPRCKRTWVQHLSQILFGGMTPTREYLRRYTGYVEQFDTLLPILTVEEMMLYTAELKRPMSESIESKKKAVEDLVTDLGLDVCR